MFDAWRKKLEKAVNEEEEIQFKSFYDRVEEDEDDEVQNPIGEAAQESSSLEGNNIELKVVRPESMEEIFTIADYIISGCTVVLNLEVLDRTTITRMLDFLNGVTYTKSGEVKNVSPGTYIITPGGININR